MIPLLLTFALHAPGLPPAAPSVAVTWTRSPQEIERAKTWPELDADGKKLVKTQVARLRKARTETMGADAAEQLAEVGPACAPALLDALGHEKDAGTRDAIRAVLDRVTGAPHTRLLAQAFADRSPEVRSWALRRVARFPDAGTREAALAALERARKGKRGKKPDPELVYAASLACAAAGSPEGLDVLLVAARERWAQEAGALRVAVAALRGEELTSRLVGELHAPGREERLAALHLLAVGGVAPAAVEAVAPLLDSEDVGLVTAAINALRGIVDGDPPLDRLSVFDAIERAKSWKKRLP